MSLKSANPGVLTLLAIVFSAALKFVFTPVSGIGPNWRYVEEPKPIVVK